MSTSTVINQPAATVLDDPAFKRRVIAKDPASLGILYKQAFGLIFKAVKYELKSSGLFNREDLADVTSDAWVKIHLSVGTFQDRGPDSLQRWMAMVARNHARDERKKIRRRAKALLKSEDRRQADCQHQDEEGVEEVATQTMQSLHSLCAMRALSTLKGLNLKVIRAEVLNEIGYDEIDERSDVPKETIESRSKRAIKALRTAYEREWAECEKDPEAYRLKVTSPEGKHE